MHFLSNSSQMNATEPFEGLANVGPGFGLVPPVAPFTNMV